MTIVVSAMEFRNILILQVFTVYIYIFIYFCFRKEEITHLVMKMITANEATETSDKASESEDEKVIRLCLLIISCLICGMQQDNSNLICTIFYSCTLKLKDS